MNDLKKEVFIKFIGFLNKFFYSYYFLPILAVLLYLLNNFLIKDLFICFAIFLLICIFWLIKLIYVPKNKSKKYGIIFLIDNNTYYNSNVNIFFKKLSFELEKYFKIQVVNKNCLKKYNTKERRDKIQATKNYQMLINTFALNAKENDNMVFSLDNKTVTFFSPVNELDKKTMNNLKKDLNNGFQRIVKLRESETYTDINENSIIMANSIRYLVSIIFILFGDFDNSKKLLDEINFENLPTNSKTVQYLRKNIVRRYIDINFNLANIIVNEQKYLYDDIELKKLEEKVNILETLIHSNNFIGYYAADFYDMKSKLLYARTNYYECEGYVTKLNKKYPNNNGILLSLAFICINNNNIKKGVEIYKKISKKKDVKIREVDECIRFVNFSLESDRYNVINLKLCLGLLTYYWKNKEEGVNILQSILNDLDNKENKKYIEVRYIKN